MHVPRTLDEWTLDAIQALADGGAAENMDFDFKAGALMAAPNGASSLSKAVCAFANARGGFLVIGVTDKPPRTVDGVAGGPEFQKHLHDRIKVYPALPFPDARLLPVKGGRFVAILQVPAGDEGPYASTADNRTDFYVRTQRGAEPMSWIQVRDAMMRADQRRRQVDLLLQQLSQHYLTARNHSHASREAHSFPETEFFELTITHAAYAALHPWLSKNVHAMQALSQLLARMNYINGQIQAMIVDVAANPPRLKDWRGRMAVNVAGFRDLVIQADANIRTAFEMPHPHFPNAYPQY